MRFPPTPPPLTRHTGEYNLVQIDLKFRDQNYVIYHWKALHSTFTPYLLVSLVEMMIIIKGNENNNTNKSADFDVTSLLAAVVLHNSRNCLFCTCAHLTCLHTHTRARTCELGGTPADDGLAVVKTLTHL